MESKKRKLHDVKSSQGTKPPEKKRNKKNKKRKKNQKARDENSVSQNNISGEPMEVEESPIDEPPTKNKSKNEEEKGLERNTKGSQEPMQVDNAPMDKPPSEDNKSTNSKNDTENCKFEADPKGEAEEREKVEKESVKGTLVKQKPEKEKPANDKTSKSKSSKKSKKMIKAGKGVTYRVLKKGNAGVNKAKKGDTITLLYVGCLKDGKQFDTNLKDGLTFKLGGEEVIPGIELGVYGMSPKEKRRIIIPAEQGYGADGDTEGKIPPNAELHFTVQRK